MEVLYNIRRWESEIAKGRETERERYKDNRLPKQNNVYGTTEDTYNSS